MEGMGVCVEIISKEMVKPSSPTPPHLTNLNLSYLDQLARPIYFPIIFFFQSNQSNQSKALTISNHIQISRHLKHSLSHALVPFYPLAGRLSVDDNSVVDCNDAGVEFVDARVHARVTDVVRAPNLEELKRFLPLDPTTAGEPGELALIFFQLTFFDCGGVAIGVCFSHTVADCASVMALVGAWADTCRVQGHAPLTSLGFSFDMHKYFPPRSSLVSRVPSITSGEKFTTRRLVFDKNKLSILRECASSSSSSSSLPQLNNPTRVELMSGFIWLSFLKARRSTNKVQAAYHSVNLRPRFNRPRVLENVIGNGVMFSFALADSGCGVEEGYQYHDLIRRLRNSIKEIDEHYITKAQNGDDYINDVKYRRVLDHEYCSFSSWTRFPMYDVDFGWGSPLWCCTTALPAKNLVVLMNSRDGEDIEAWVINMDEHSFEMLQTQFQLISTMNS